MIVKNKLLPRVEPATGRVRWLEPCRVTGRRMLEIVSITRGGEVTQTYAVEQDSTGFTLEYISDGFELVRYRVAPVSGVVGAWTCSCPDLRARSGGCKHCRGLRAAIAKEVF